MRKVVDTCIKNSYKRAYVKSSEAIKAYDMIRKPFEKSKNKHTHNIIELGLKYRNDVIHNTIVEGYAEIDFDGNGGYCLYIKLFEKKPFELSEKEKECIVKFNKEIRNKETKEEEFFTHELSPKGVLLKGSDYFKRDISIVTKEIEEEIKVRSLEKYASGKGYKISGYDMSFMHNLLGRMYFQSLIEKDWLINHNTFNEGLNQLRIENFEYGEWHKIENNYVSFEMKRFKNGNIQLKNLTFKDVE